MNKFRAEIVLNDCRLALEKFDEQLIDDEFRLNLVLNLALLRAVGHCLNDELGSKDTHYVNKKEDRIYKEFICDFRNKILKNYKACVSWEVSSNIDSDTSKVNYLITDGSYKDKDVRHVIAEAIVWWEIYIAELKKIL